MTLTQLEYLVAVDKFRHFGRAAEFCGVSQPTLSMQIQKLEDAWRVSLFDRSRKPVEPTYIGAQIISQAKEVLLHAKKLEDVLEVSRGKFQGTLKVGVIPTISPYLLHRIIPDLQRKYPKVNWIFTEATTDDLLRMIRENAVDTAILATPLNELGTEEQVLYFEPFMAFLNARHPLAKESFILNSELKIDDLLLLTEGHCFRNSVLQMCEAHIDNLQDTGRLQLESGSFETLVKLVKSGLGMTLIPYLLAVDLPEVDRKWVRPIAEPRPVREIGLIYSKNQLKTSLINALAGVIKDQVPDRLLRPEGQIYTPR
jgi:LysR family transcriptional regulator, hydrogen peroxide-inducible genes activator